MDKISIGLRLKEARLKKGFTQKDLSNISGIHIVYISEIERGSKMPSINTFIKIIEALNISADYILRNNISSGKYYVFNEVTERLKDITPSQRKCIVDIIDAYLRNI